MKRLFLMPVLLTAFSCASTLTGTRESITVDSTPAGADVALVCAGTRVDGGVTPTTLRFWRNAGDCTLTVSKSGFAEETKLIEQGVNPAYWANFVTTPVASAGVFIAEYGNAPEKAVGAALIIAAGATWLVDYRTGAMHRHRPSAIRATLRAKE